MSFSAYPEYKNFGVELFGEVPSSWSVQRLKQIVSPSRPITYGIVQAGENVPNGIAYIRPADMTEESGVKAEDALLRTSQEIASAYRRSSISAGDIVCSIGPSFGKLMMVPPSLEGANLTQGTARVAVSNEHVSRFIFWVLRSTKSYQQWESSVGGATFRALNLGPLAETSFCVPSWAEQAQIARFLDHETARIDALIEEQQRLIELLKEKRQAVISHAVTKGLDPTVPMKDSGVEWLGEVPAHWEVIALKRLAKKITDGEHISPQFTDEGMPFLSAKNIRDRVVEYNVEKYVSLEDGLRFRRRCNPEINDVLIVSRGATIGRVGLVEQEVIFCLLGSVILLKAKSDITDPVFIYYMLNQNSAQEQFQLASQASAQQAIYLVDVAELSVVLPPLAEQIKIRESLELLVEEVNNLIYVANDAIALMQERRSALISAAVTGKIDVRGWQPPASVPTPELAQEAV